MQENGEGTIGFTSAKPATRDGGDVDAVPSAGLPHPAPSPSETYSVTRPPATREAGGRITHARGAAAGRRAKSQRLAAGPCLRVLCSNHFSGVQGKGTRYSPRLYPPVRVLRSLLAPASQLPSASSTLHRFLRAVAPGLGPQPPVIQHLSARRDTVLSGSLCPLGPAPVVKGFRKMVMDQHTQCPASGRTSCVQCEGRGCPCSKQGRDVGSD